MDAEFLRYKFEDGYDGVVVKNRTQKMAKKSMEVLIELDLNRFKFGVRHLQIFYMCACTAVMGAMRGSTGLALITCADPAQNSSYVQIHDWNRTVQGKILSSYFFGYALMLMPAELYLRRLGGKLVLTGVLVVNGALTVAMPTIANRGGWIAVYNAQLLLGMTQACLSSSNQVLLGKWLPPNERGIFSCLVYSSLLVGMQVAMPIAGLLSESHLGWELVFYTQAMMTVSMATIWVLLTASKPEKHQALGDTEKEYIREALSSYKKVKFKNHKEEHKKMQIPWQQILRSKQFWAIACAHTASNSVFVFYLVDVPAFIYSYMPSLRTTGWHSALPFLAFWLVQKTTAPSLDWLSRVLHIGSYSNVTYFRKLISCLGAAGVMAGLVSVPSLVPQWGALALVALCGALGSLGLQMSGFLENIKDISQNYSGTLFMMSTAVASTVGALVPLITGFIIGDDVQNSYRWRAVFLSLASFYLVCNVFYLIFASSSRQIWDGGAIVKDKFSYDNHNILGSNPVELEELSSMPAQKKYYDSEY